MSIDETRDLQLEQALKDAYDELDPTPDAQERMLQALKAAQEQREAPAAPTQKQARRRIAPWKVALPAAACLALAAIGVGVATTMQPPSIDDTSTENLVATSRIDGAEGMTDEAYESVEAPLMLDTAMVDDGFNTEEYAAVKESGFMATATNPLSTVSADVDTASYCNLRRMINQGSSLGDIPAGAVRIEEMLNYFDYDYAAPTGNDAFSIQAQVGPCPWNADTQLLVLGFATAPETLEQPSNLVFLIDVSGSMDDPAKLDLLQDSFATLLEHLDADDRISIVTYSGEEEVVLDGAAGNDDRAILRAIYRLQAEGSTNGEAGLRMAYDVAQRNYIEGGVNRIIMASDGDLNVGMTSESDLFDFVQEKRSSGIYLSVLGFGSGNYKDTKMETLADNGNGQYHYIDCIEEAERVLSHNLMANIVPFADDVKVQVEFNPAQVKGYRLIGYENRQLEAQDFLDDEKDAGDIGPNAQFTVAYEIVPVSSSMEINVPDLHYSQQETTANANSTDWLTCSLRYRAFSDSQVHQQQLAVTGTEGTNADWTFAAAVIEAGMSLRGSEYAGTSTLENALRLLDGMQLNENRQGFATLLQQALAMGTDAEPLIEDGTIDGA